MRTREGRWREASRFAAVVIGVAFSIGLSPVWHSAKGAENPASAAPRANIFEGTYLHRASGKDLFQSKLKRESKADGSTLYTAACLQEMYSLLADAQGRPKEYGVSWGTSPGLGFQYVFSGNEIVRTVRKPRVPPAETRFKPRPGSLPDFNARPDPYLMEHVLLRAYDMAKGGPQTLRVYDMDNRGTGFQEYGITLKLADEEGVLLPNGKFKARHIVQVQEGGGGTWFSKSPGSQTDVWADDDLVILRVYRHREPYEVILQDYNNPKALISAGETAQGLTVPPKATAPTRTTPKQEAPIIPVAKKPLSSEEYSKDFEFMWKEIGERYPGELFKAKKIDWPAVRSEYEPKVKAAKSDEEFVKLCAEVVGKLRDGHSYVLCKTIPSEKLYPREERISPGAGLIECKGGQIAVLQVYPNSDADKAGLKKGMVVTKIDGEDALSYAEKRSRERWENGYTSSERAARWSAVWTLLSGRQDTEVKVEAGTEKGQTKTYALKRSFGQLLRCPKLRDYVSVAGMKQAGPCSYQILPGKYGYIHIVKFTGKDGGRSEIERILQEFKDAKGLIVDVRGNGGGYVPQVQWPQEKPTVVIIDPGTFSAGEGFAADFGFLGNPKGHPNLKIIGRATAGSSSEKCDSTVPSGLFSFHYSIRGRRGAINCGPDGTIEYYGVRPDVEVMPEIEDLKRGEDTFIKRAVELLNDRERNNTVWPIHKVGG